MGKRILGVIAFAAIAAVAGWNYQQNKQEVELSDLALENVEAFARWEKPNKDMGKRDCFKKGVITGSICVPSGYLLLVDCSSAKPTSSKYPDKR